MPGFRSSRTPPPARSRSGPSRSGGSCGCRPGAASGWACDCRDEAVEQVQRVVRAGSRLGVILHGRSGHVLEREALNGAVVEVDVAQLGLAEVRVPANRLVVVDRPRAVRAEDCETVILAGDLGAAGRE